MARPTKRTPETEQTLLTVLAAGNTRRAACAYAGISEDTLGRWLVADADFAGRIRQKEIEPLIQSIGRIRQAAQGGAVLKETTVTTTRPDGTSQTRTIREYSRPEWTADAWWAERKYAEDFGRKDTLRIERDRIIEDTRQLARESGADEEAAVAEVKRYLGVR